MFARLHDGRHHPSHRRQPATATATVATATAATARRSRLAAIAVPTVAAAILTFTATGAALAANAEHSTQSMSIAPVASQTQTQSTQLTTGIDAADDLSAYDARVQATERARVQATERASRAAQRQALAVRKAQALAAAKTWQLPLAKYRLTSGFGMRWGRLHAGNDFSVPVGTPLMAMSTGVVVFAGAQGGYGNKVEIRYWDGTVSYYGHMSKISVKKGQAVAKGQVVGKSGNTGRSTGPHLHLEIHPRGGAPTNPIPWLAAHGVKP